MTTKLFLILRRKKPFMDRRMLKYLNSPREYFVSR